MRIYMQEARTPMDPARCRQELTTRIEELPDLLRPAYERTPLVPGVVYLRRIRCGKATCHCADGPLHEYMSLGTWAGGKRDVRRIRPEEDIEEHRTTTERYRAVRAMRRSFLQWSRRVVKLLDEMEAARIKSPTRGTSSKGK